MEVFKNRVRTKFVIFQKTKLRQAISLKKRTLCVVLTLALVLGSWNCAHHCPDLHTLQQAFAGL